MVYRKRKNNFYVKKWVLILYKLFIKCGRKSQAFSLINKFLIELIRKKKKLNFFFFLVNKYLCVPVILKKHVVAGRKIIIPIRCSFKKEINFSVRLLIKSVKLRQEKGLLNRIINEFLDIVQKKGSSIKKKMQYCREIKSNVPNLRFLKS